MAGTGLEERQVMFWIVLNVDVCTQRYPDDKVDA